MNWKNSCKPSRRKPHLPRPEQPLFPLAHGANRIRSGRQVAARKVSDFSGPEHLRSDLIDSINDYRREQSELLIGDFNPETFKPSESGFLRIGAGSLGARRAGSHSCAISCARVASYVAFPAFASRCRLLWSWPPMPSINSWQKTICWISLCNATTMPKFCRNFWHLLFPSSCRKT